MHTLNAITGVPVAAYSQQGFGAQLSKCIRDLFPCASHLPAALCRGISDPYWFSVIAFLFYSLKLLTAKVKRFLQTFLSLVFCPILFRFKPVNHVYFTLISTYYPGKEGAYE